MKVWTCTDFEGVWPVGTAAVVVAETEADAQETLRMTLLSRKLPDWPFTLQEVALDTRAAYLLCDGDY